MIPLIETAFQIEALGDFIEFRAQNSKLHTSTKMSVNLNNSSLLNAIPATPLKQGSKLVRCSRNLELQVLQAQLEYERRKSDVTIKIKPSHWFSENQFDG